jgi:hypothetical protein
MARLSPGWHELVRATDSVCVRVRLPACVSVCVRLHVCMHARGSVRVLRACVCVWLECVCISGCARCCATQGGSSDAQLVLAGYEGYSEGTRGVLDGYSRRTHALVKRSSRGSHRLTGCTLGYSGGTPRMCVRACDAVPLLGRMAHHDGDARHCKASLSAHWLNRRGSRRVLTSAYVSCNPSPRVRLRRDARADARAHHRRAGRCAVGCVLPCAPPSAHCSAIECIMY